MTSWPDEVCELFTKLTLEKRLDLKHISGDHRKEKIVVDLHEAGGPLPVSDLVHEMMQEFGLVGEEPSGASPSYQATRLTPGTKYIGYVPHAENPDHLWVQLDKTRPQLDELADRLQLHYAACQECLETVSIGDDMVARSAEYDCWYRARVMSTEGGCAVVQFVDYGNSETLPISALCPLYQQFADLPSQAVPCSLYGVEPAAEIWDGDATSDIIMCEGKQVLVEVLSQTADSYLVNVFNMGLDISKSLIDKGLAQYKDDNVFVNSRTQAVPSTVLTQRITHFPSSTTTEGDTTLDTTHGVEDSGKESEVGQSFTSQSEDSNLVSSQSESSQLVIDESADDRAVSPPEISREEQEETTVRVVETPSPVLESSHDEEQDVDTGAAGDMAGRENVEELVEVKGGLMGAGDGMFLSTLSPAQEDQPLTEVEAGQSPDPAQKAEISASQSPDAPDSEEAKQSPASAKDVYNSLNEMGDCELPDLPGEPEPLPCETSANQCGDLAVVPASTEKLDAADETDTTEQAVPEPTPDKPKAK